MHSGFMQFCPKMCSTYPKKREFLVLCYDSLCANGYYGYVWQFRVSDSVRKKDMVVAVILGLISGAVGFLPLLLGWRLAKNATKTSNLGHAGALMMGVLLSFVLIFVFAILCIVFARDVVLPYVLGEVGALCVCAAIFGITKQLRR